MKKMICLILIPALLLLGGCNAQVDEGPQKYTQTYWTLFDTITYITGYAESQEAFNEAAQALYDELLEYHRLFDIYNDYEGLNNLKTVNDNAGVAPVHVDSRIISLLLDCRNYYEATGGLVNVAMGSVLRLWHEAREDSLNDPANAYLPDPDALTEAAAHTDWGNVIIDREASTVFLADPEIRLDVGAVAKGWSLQQVAQTAPDGMLISLGGNVGSTGAKADGSAWVVGVTDPEDTGAYVHTLNLTEGFMVTSGDYQRYYEVDGVAYHHIIDPNTRYPSTHWRSVTIICDDSGLADALSTALFLLPMEEGQALLDGFSAEAMWVDQDGNCYYSTNFESYILS